MGGRPGLVVISSGALFLRMERKTASFAEIAHNQSGGHRSPSGEGKGRIMRIPMSTIADTVANPQSPTVKIAFYRPYLAAVLVDMMILGYPAFRIPNRSFIARVQVTFFNPFLPKSPGRHFWIRRSVTEGQAPVPAIANRIAPAVV